MNCSLHDLVMYDNMYMFTGGCQREPNNTADKNNNIKRNIIIIIEINKLENMKNARKIREKTSYVGVSCSI